MQFKELVNPEVFFKILPEDWQEGLVDFYKKHRNQIAVHAFLDEDKIVAGGMVFSVCPPDMLFAYQEAQAWLEKGFQYLGFIYVVPHRRSEGLGSKWLKELKTVFPTQSYWLTIEDFNLNYFYIQNGFKKEGILKHDGTEEWLYSYSPKV